MHCSRTQLVKDIRTRQINRTVFGKITIACRRYIRCTYQGRRPSILWPVGLLDLMGSTPELSYLLAKWGSILPYRRAAEMLSELLPISDGKVGPLSLPGKLSILAATIDESL